MGDIRKMGEEMRGKTDEEKSKISRRYKKLIIKPPVRKKNRPARRPKPLSSAKIHGERRLLFHRLFRLNVHIAARIRVDRIGRAQRAAGQQNVIAGQLKLGHAITDNHGHVERAAAPAADCRATRCARCRRRA